MTGTVISVLASAYHYGGTFGEIQGDDGQIYCWSSGNVFRNFSHLDVGVRVSFVVVSHSYASSIDQLDKPSRQSRQR